MSDKELIALNATKLAVLLIIGYAIAYGSQYALDLRSADQCIAGFVHMTFATILYRFFLFVDKLRRDVREPQ